MCSFWALPGFVQFTCSFQNPNSRRSPVHRGPGKGGWRHSWVFSHMRFLTLNHYYFFVAFSYFERSGQQAEIEWKWVSGPILTGREVAWFSVKRSLCKIGQKTNKQKKTKQAVKTNTHTHTHILTHSEWPFSMLHSTFNWKGRRKKNKNCGAPSKVNFSQWRASQSQGGARSPGTRPPEIGTDDLLLEPKHEPHTLPQVTLCTKNTYWVFLHFKQTCF